MATVQDSATISIDNINNSKMSNKYEVLGQAS